MERLVNGAWQVVAVDSSFDTLLRFERAGGIIYAQVEWTVPNATAGTFRITHRASALHALGHRLEEFVGVSREFSVGEAAAASDAASPPSVWLQTAWDAPSSDGKRVVFVP